MDSKTEQKLNEMRAKYLAQAQQVQQGQEDSSYDNAVEIGRQTQSKSSGGGFKGFLLGVASVGAAMAVWFGGQKHGEAKASVGRADAALNNRPTITQDADSVAIGDQKPAGVTMVDLPKADVVQQSTGVAVTQTPASEPETRAAVTQTPAPEPETRAAVTQTPASKPKTGVAVTQTTAPKNDKPMTLQEQIRMLALTRDKKMKDCASQNDLRGVAQAQRDFDEAYRVLTGQPTRADRKDAVRDATEVASAAANISRSGAQVAANARSAVDSVGRMQQVDPAARNADTAAYDAAKARARHVEAEERNSTIEENIRVVEHINDGITAGIESTERTLRAVQRFGDFFRK